MHLFLAPHARKSYLLRNTYKAKKKQFWVILGPFHSCSNLHVTPFSSSFIYRGGETPITHVLRCDFRKEECMMCALLAVAHLAVEFEGGGCLRYIHFNRKSCNLPYKLFITKNCKRFGLLTKLYFAPPLFIY